MTPNSAHGRLLRPTMVYRWMLRQHPDITFVFGDNVLRVGMGGQAKEMRGEPNALGIPTKYSPGMGEQDFFSDRNAARIVKLYILAPMLRLMRELQAGRDVAFPADGIGTGLSQLPTRAPQINNLIQAFVLDLTAQSNENKSWPLNWGVRVT
jgi:hypothetical protein